MKRFFLITNEQRDTDLSVSHAIQDYIAQKGGECGCYVSSKAAWSSRSLQTLQAIQSEGTHAECILVLGGDGTLVRAARETAQLGIPLIGINLGTIGYLCELDAETVFPAIDRLFEDQYEVERRMMIEGVCPGEEEEATVALNDIVIHRTGGAQLINLDLTVGGEFLATFSADGMILSTPTGSTGYNMSAGGPIVDPKTELLLITPINPQSLTARRIVVGADAKVELMLSERRSERDEEAEVSFDGDHFVHLHVGDRILVQKAAVYAQILRLDRLSFLQTLRKKIT